MLAEDTIYSHWVLAVLASYVYCVGSG